MDLRRSSISAINLGLALAGTALPFLGLEAALRIQRAMDLSKSAYARAADPRLVFVHRPHTNPETNAQGFRDREHAAEKAPGGFRILVLGDSVTYGYGVGAEQMYTRLLETRLASHRPLVEVVNFGINQYSTAQEVALLETTGLPLRPDVVMLAYVLNDPTPDGSINEFFGDEQSYFLAWPRLVRGARAARCRVTGRCGADVLPGCHYFDYYSGMHCEAAKWQQVRTSFDQLARLERQQGFRIMLVVFPLLDSLADATFAQYRWREIHQRVIAEARRNGFATLDLLPAFARYLPAEIKIATDDMLHPNALGHRIAAEAMAHALIDGGIVPAD